jgi:signal peptidase I
MSSNFPNGFVHGINIRGLPILQLHPGEVFWVNTSSVGPTGSNGNDGTYKYPFSTYDYAIGRCVANRGDIIVIRPGHAENITAASGVTNDVAGVATIGLGTGS